MPRRIPYHRPAGADHANHARIAAYERGESRMEDKRFYASKRWRRTRRAFLSENPFCVDCKAEGRLTPAEHVHHDKPRKTHPDLAFDWTNLVGLCESCHTKREASERGRLEPASTNTAASK